MLLIIYLFSSLNLSLIVLSSLILILLISKNVHKKTSIKYDIIHRAKHLAVDVFQYRFSFFLIGLLFSLSFVFIVMNATFLKAEKQFIYPDYTPDPILNVDPPLTKRKEEIVFPKEEVKTKKQVLTPKIIEVFETKDLAKPDLIDLELSINEPIIETKSKVIDEGIPKPLPLPEIVEDEDEIKRFVEEMPRFPGCEELNMSIKEKENCAKRNMLAYIYDRLRYPSIARENRIEGTVVLQFVVNKKGLIENIEIKRDIGGECGKSAKKTLEGMNNMESGHWIPGRQNGREVSVLYTIPIRFQLRG